MKKMFFCIFILLTCFGLNGQDLPNIIPPSPNAASLGQYADIPVSNYTGVPNISIPLYTATSGDIQLPITLNYHGSGIKVAQEASWVGLGWSLNAGGMITRQIRGIDDFHWRGYINTEPIPSVFLEGIDDREDYDGENDIHNSRDFDYIFSNTGQEIERYNYVIPIFQGKYDIQPDIFYYNFLGYSGKFLFEKQRGNILEATLLEQNNLSISYNKELNQWLIIDGNGQEYSFNEKEYTNTRSGGGKFWADEKIFFNIGPAQPIFPHTSITSWSLNTIKTAKGNELRFLYDDSKKYATVGQLYASEKEYKRKSLYDYKGLFPSGYDIYRSTQQVVSDVYLKKIEFDNGYMLFTTEDRTDMRAVPGYLNPQRLKDIEVFNLKGESIKKLTMHYDYFGSSTSSNVSRLKLNSIQEVSKRNNSYNTKPPYTFTYNNTTRLPKKNSFEIDHWGYYNSSGNSNTTISTEYDLSTNSVKYKGANREPHKEKMKAHVLQTIKYPTGGKVAFEFESNTYQKATYKLENRSVFASDDSSTEMYSKTKFILKKLTLINLGASFRNEDWTTNQHDPCSGNHNSIMHGRSWLKKENGDIIHSFRVPNEAGTYYKKDYTFNLPPGSYYIETDNNDNDCLEVNVYVDYLEKIIETKNLGGGLRVKSIQTFDQNGEFLKKKNYSYTSGLLMSPVNYHYQEKANNFYDPTPGSTGSPFDTHLVEALYTVRTSNSTVPLAGSSQGNIVGYGGVTVKDSDATGKTLGASSFSYKNINLDLPVSQVTPPRGLRFNNGVLLVESHFNGNNKLIKNKTIRYKEEKESEIRLKTFLLGGGDLSLLPSSLKIYNIISKWWHPSSETETIYDLEGNNPITTSVNYEYENATHKNLTKTTQQNSQQKEIVTTYEYPSDFPTGTETATDVFDKMIARNMLNPVIKQQTKVDTNVLSTQINNYEEWGLNTDGSLNLLLPEKIQTAKGSQPLEDRIIYHDYDNKGNPTEVSKKDGTHIVYIWGYNRTQPIAKIENATYSEVLSQVSNLQSLSDIDDDRTIDIIEDDGSVTKVGKEGDLREALRILRNAFPNAQVTTFTYDPLIGVTSITDPRGETVYYHYDDFNRLEFVKDAQGDILSKNAYNYKR
ncbi:MAG: YD repeat-containing protein [Ulvibacter sp.]|jgi:YD repeat-containing protein